MNPLDTRRLRLDVTWNLAAFGLMAVGGLVVNILIARHYGPAALGVFNQAFAIYLIVSQLAVFGIGHSALKHVAEHADARSTADTIAAAALIAAGVLALLAVVFSYFLIQPIEVFFSSRHVADAWLMIFAGIWPYSMNKVYLAVLNGHRNMRAYALSQMSRYILIVLVLCAAILADIDGAHLTLAISIPEFVLFGVLASHHAWCSNAGPIRTWLPWIAQHLRFGAKAMPGGVLADLNTRVDVLVLGYFHTDARVGIYSIASLVAEGIALISVALRDNLNPLITRMVAIKDYQGLAQLARRTVRTFGVCLAIILIIASAAYPQVLGFLVADQAFNESWSVFLILAFGIALRGGYLPLGMILGQAGLPGRQTQQRFFMVSASLILGVLLTPGFDVYGAAAAMSVAGVISTIYLRILARQHLGIKI